MVDLYLQNQIANFVRRFFCVEEVQIHRFFSDYDTETVNHELDTLLRTNRLFRVSDTRISFRRKLPIPINHYDATIRALYVMCDLPSKKVRWYSCDEYPAEILFLTEDDIIYDVTIFTETDWVGKYAMIKRTKGKSIPKGEVDPVNHIAIIPDKDFIPKIEELGFTFYATLDRNNHVYLYSYED